MIGRALQMLGSFNSTVVQGVLEHLGELPTGKHKKTKRAQMLLEQLKPQGTFVGDKSVYATGNGCYTMIGWVHNMLTSRDVAGDFMQDHNSHGWARFRALDLPPKTVDR